MNSKWEYFILACVSCTMIFIGWWIVTAAGLVKDFFLPSPFQALEAMFQLFSERNFLRDIAISVERIFLGFFFAAILGVPIGILIGLNKKAEALIEPIIDFIRYTPIPAFIPLFILWFGVGELEKIMVIAASVFFQLVLMVANSVSLTPQTFIESAHTLGAAKWHVVRKVVYPFSKPRILDDLRVSMGWAWSGLILAEIVGSTSGLGFVIIQSQRLLNTANVVAVIIIVGLLGIATDYIFKWIYKAYFPWAPKTDFYAKVQ